MFGKTVTRDDVAKYIKHRLGYPSLELELELESREGLGHIQIAIQDSLDWMFRHNQDESNFADYMVLQLKPGIIEYDVPAGITDVIDVAPSYGNGFTPWSSFDVGPTESLVSTTGWAQFDMVTYIGAMRYLADVQKNVGIVYNVSFHPVALKLRLFPTPKSYRTVMCKVYRKAALSDVFDNILFRDLVVARTKVIWGEIISRDDFTLPGGGKVDGSTLLQNARSDQEKVEKQIYEESSRPMIITDLSL
jgi:hypothetical protein